jgi:glycosyltransferase involved in cell wall biosynthesis
MKRKAKIILKVAKKATKKMLNVRGYDNFYKGKNLIQTVDHFLKYPIKNGPRATVSKLKKELVRISGNGMIKHHFPNGIVSGVDARAISRWKSDKSVSIVIPSYNDYDLLKVCVQSIHNTCKEDDYEIIIVDDYCQEENRNKLKLLSDDKTRLIFREQNGGFAKAVNTGLREVPKTNDVVILNSDIEAHDGWLKALQYGAYEFGENVGIVGPKLLYPDGRIQSAGSYRNTEDPEWFDHYYRFQESDYGPANVPQYTLGITGACQYVKRELIDAIGILDEGFEFAFEDMDYCLRGWGKNYRTLYFPASTLTHHESATRAKNKNIGEKEKQAVVYFWEKWGDWFDNRNVKNEHGQTRIIFVLQTLGYSGGIKIVVEHANRLAEAGFAPEIWSLDDGAVWPINVPTRSFKNYRKLIAALEDEEAIKVATWWETAFPVWLSSIRKGIAVNFIQEIESWFYPNDPDAQRTVISCYRKEFKNMTTSSYNLDEIQQLGLKADLIPCGYDETVYFKQENVPKEKDVLLSVGRSFFQKNFDFSLRSWKALGEKRPRFWLFGSEPDMKSLDDRITYHFKPSDNEVNDLYNQATVFMQTSRHEGFCIPLLEAMATGTPVIATDAHGNRDFCIDGKTALMVDHDDTNALTAAIERLLKDKKLQDKLSRNALKEAEKYTWPVITGKLVKFYDKIEKQNHITEKVVAKYGK